MSGLSVSVVIASGAGGEFLFRCLDGLREQAAESSSEVIVVDRCGPEITGRIRRNYSFVTLLEADRSSHRPTVPELRKLGASHAHGDVVAIIEEHCVAPATWIRTIQSSFREGDVAVGGPILHDSFSRVEDWVVYFSEYHNYLPPWANEQRYLLNGANIAYLRAKLLEHEAVLTGGYWEVVLHPLLARGGAGFRAVPELGVRHTGPFDFRYYLHQRYLLSRVWGGTQRDRVTPAQRLVYLVAAPVLPPMLLARISSRVLKSEVPFGRLVRAMPLLVPVAVTYVTGEWLGYLLGPGRALESVK